MIKVIRYIETTKGDSYPDATYLTKDLDKEIKLDDDLIRFDVLTDIYEPFEPYIDEALENTSVF